MSRANAIEEFIDKRDVHRRLGIWLKENGDKTRVRDRLQVDEMYDIYNSIYVVKERNKNCTPCRARIRKKLQDYHAKYIKNGKVCK